MPPSSRLPALSVIAIAALLLASCGGTRVTSSDNILDFRGLATLLAASQSEPSPKPARVFMIHGMKHQSREYAWPMIKAIAEQMNLSCNGTTPCLPSLPTPIEIDLPNSHGKARLDKYELTSTRSNQRNMEIFALTWSEMTQPIKKSALAEPNIGDRVLFNAFLKDDIMIDGFGDAVLYVGTYGRIMGEAVKHALCYVVGGTPQHIPNQGTPACNSIPPARVVALRSDEPQEPVAFISFSLGSMMLYRALEDLTARSSERGSSADKATDPGTIGAFTRLTASTDQVYMMANQISLLQLAALELAIEKSAEGVSPGGGKATSAAVSTPPLINPMKMVRNALRGSGSGVTPKAVLDAAGPRKLEIVAFSDPNDMLSFEFDTKKAEEDTRALNVYTEIASPWLGLVANPLTAHTGHSEDDTVMKFLACGGESGKPRKC